MIFHGLGGAAYGSVSPPEIGTTISMYAVRRHGQLRRIALYSKRTAWRRMVHVWQTLLALAGITVFDQAGHAAPVRAASWRAGGVRSAIDAGVSVPMIMMLRRWRSMVWEHYYMQPSADIRMAQLAMWRPSTATPATIVVGDLLPNAIVTVEDRREHGD